MGQSWKTLLLVVIGAAIAGWVTVRAIGGGRRERAVETAAVVASPTPAAPAPTAADVVTPPPGPVPSPAAAASVEPPPAPAEGDESEVIARELEILAQALVTDQRITDMIMPRVNEVLDVPSTVQYRRSPDFWQSALTPADEEMTP